MKKKGLIISTVVMVVVLIASLTTATYAWFTSQAQATVDDLAITTEAATGLQIAMTKTKGTIDKGVVSGELNYEDNTWGGDSDTWGTYLGFTSIEVGKLEHAAHYFAQGENVNVFDGYKKETNLGLDVDYYVASEQTLATGADATAYYTADTDGVLRTKDATAVEGAKYYSLAKAETVETAGEYYVINNKQETSTGAYYQPTGYDSKTNPTGYKKVDANQKGTYYYLTMAVTNMMDVGALGFSIEVVPSGETNLSGTKTASVTNPGMAAATRIKVETQKRGGTAKEAEIAPFSAWKLQTSNTMTQNTEATHKVADDGARNTNGKYTCVLEGNGNVTAGQIYFVTMVIWVEGEDAECKNITTGTAMNFNIKFAYSAKGETDIAWDFEDGTEITLTDVGA